MKRTSLIAFYLLLAIELVFFADVSMESWTATPVVEVEEDVLTYTSPNNGAGPLWCYGSSLIVRCSDRVFLSVNETGKDVPPLCNTRWRLYERKSNGWILHAVEDKFREREPCPLVLLSGDSLVLSVNPSTEPPGVKYGPCDPHILRFSIPSPQNKPEILRPAWAEGTYFTDHSYRGIAADSESNEILLLNINAKTSEQFYCLRSGEGNWIAKGKIAFPIRACYPQVALKNHAAHVLAIGDIVEPVEEWRAFKKEKTGRSWDYVFRRLFYTYSPELSSTGFCEPIEIENLDAVSGHIRNLDLWIAGDGDAWLLYTKSTVQNSMMRDRFFPDTKIQTSLECAVVRDGNISRRFTIARGGEGLTDPLPHYARFHAAPNGRLYVVTYVSGVDREGNRYSENRIQPLLPRLGKAVKIPLKEPLRSFFTAAERGGSEPSPLLDLYGLGSRSSVLRYARIRLK